MQVIRQASDVVHVLDPVLRGFLVKRIEHMAKDWAPDQWPDFGQLLILEEGDDPAIVHHDQPVDAPGFQRPACLFAQDRDIGHAGGPGHHPLLGRHQADDPARILDKWAQQRRGKAEPDDGLAFGLGPQGDHLIADRALRHTPQRGAIIEIPQVKHVQMHCNGL